jgi:hypothetical protein
MTDEPTLQLGYTSPMVREDLFGIAKNKRLKKKRNPIGFVHFGEPEEEPRSYIDEYIQAIEDAGQEEFHDELYVGFTAPIDPGDVI